MISFDNKLSVLLQEINRINRVSSDTSWRDIIPLIDLTMLDSHATPQAIYDLSIKGMQNDVAAICVFPEHLDYIDPNIKLKRATVINFPTGSEPQHQLLERIEHTVAAKKVDEIDYVFPYQDYLAGKQHEALANCHDLFLLCKQHELTFKVIIETGSLPSNQLIYELSLEIINSGCDFLKTSTGKIAMGATVPAAFSMLSAIIDSQSVCGLKVSGGIKTPEQALSYMRLAQHMLDRPLNNAWFRIGASSLLDDLIKAQRSLSKS